MHALNIKNFDLKKNILYTKSVNSSNIEKKWLLVDASNISLGRLATQVAYLIRGNIVAALLGTIVGNPVTFPFIWGLIYKVGAFVISTKHIEFNNEINFNMIITQTYEIFLPMLLGGAILAIPVWLITYILTHSFISSYKKSKIKKNRNLKR